MGKKLNLKVGDTLVFKRKSGKEATGKVTAICGPSASAMVLAGGQFWTVFGHQVIKVFES